ncbi:SH3 domain-containing protein [Peribacillus muralis]|uniref:SH3 domain-containing protein n=1 Tax=Peribacillus muralis TaxID=264697 RepID=UPI003D01674E
MNIRNISRCLLVLIFVFSALPFNNSSAQAASNETKYVDIASGSLNVRSGPGSNYKKVGSLKNYAKVIVYSKTKNGWSEIRYNKKKAFVSSEFLVNINLKNSRVTYTLKDANGSKYKVYMIASNEKMAKASYDSYGWNSVWAGAADGDTLYKGDYKIYLRKNGSNIVTYTGYQSKEYIYNKTRHMVYSVPSKYKGQPDLFAVGEVMSSNFEEAQVYYVNNGKFKKIKTIGYTQRTKITGKDTYQTASYDNSVAKWYLNTYKLDTKRGTFNKTNFKKVDSIGNWRKDWK